jgi:branched-chain amino acid transport system ATP-binding protein
LLRLEGVGKRFGGLAALSNMSFAVAPGEILGLVGPNGSGKTTAINVISGVTPADSGRVLFEGQAIERLSSFRLARRGINRTFQVPKTFREMTVRENLDIAAYFSRTRRVDIRPILDETELAAHADALAGSLTVNQQKMVDLARALATDPRLLLVDEIGAGLNPHELSGIAALLQRLAARGIALIVVEHLLNFLNRVTDRVIVLSAGQKLFEGTLKAASQDPAVVAAFIGGETHEPA